MSEQDKAPREASFSRLYRGWLLTMLLGVCAINYADRSVVGALAEPLRRDLGLSDFQLGLLQGLSFALLYSVLGIPFARLAERRSRVRIIAGATVLWSAMTAACGAAANFVQLVRVGVGVGEAGFMAPASSLIGDHFPREKRAMATSIMMLGAPVGALVGAVAGCIISEELGWRLAFVIMGGRVCWWRSCSCSRCVSRHGAGLKQREIEVTTFHRLDRWRVRYLPIRCFVTS